MRHLDEGTIHASLDDALGADEAARIAAHVDGCALCAARVAEARGLIAGASRIVGSLDEGAGDVMPTFAPARARFEPATAPRRRRLVVPSAIRRTRFVVPSAIAATVIVAAGSLLVTRHAPRVDVPVHQVAPSVVPVAAAPSAAAPSAQVESVAAPSAPAPVPVRVAAKPERRGGVRQATKAAGVPAAAAPAVTALAPAAPTANVASAAEARPVQADSAQVRARMRELSAANDLAASRMADRTLQSVVVTGLAERRNERRAEVGAAAGAPTTSVMAAALKQVDGCYELTTEQVDLGAEAPKVPSRLVLMRVPVGDTARRGFLVTSVRDDGARVPEAGAVWHAIGERGVLTWPASPEPLTMSFSLAGETRAWLGAPGGTAVPVTVRAVRCR